MKKLKVMTVVGTRPEIIRLARVVAALDKYTDHILVHTGQNYDFELNEIFFNDMEIRQPDHFLSAAGKGAAETIGNTIIKIDPILTAEKPDALLVLGDTNSCLAAIPAKRRKIPIFHQMMTSEDTGPTQQENESTQNCCCRFARWLRKDDPLFRHHRRLEEAREKDFLV